MRILLTRVGVFTAVSFLLLSLGDVVQQAKPEFYNFYLAAVIAGIAVYVIQILENN